MPIYRSEYSRLVVLVLPVQAGCMYFLLEVPDFIESRITVKSAAECGTNQW